MNLKTIGKYNLTKKLGSGSFGEIFQCILPQTREEFAIKLVLTFFSELEKYLGRYKSENSSIVFGGENL